MDHQERPRDKISAHREFKVVKITHFSSFKSRILSYFLQCAKKKILKSLEYCCKCFAPKSSMCFIKMKLLHSEWRHRKISPRKLISARNGGNGLHHVSFRCMLSPSKLLFEHSHASFVFNIYTVTYSVCSKLLSVLDSSTTGGIVWKI